MVRLLEATLLARMQQAELIRDLCFQRNFLMKQHKRTEPKARNKQTGKCTWFVLLKLTVNKNTYNYKADLEYIIQRIKTEIEN
jgi:hypothetical protein